MAKFVISAGGTGGHIYPALSVAAHLIKDSHEVYFATGQAATDRSLIEDAGVKLQQIQSFNAAGFDRARPLTLLTASGKTLSSYWPAKKWLKSIKPAAVACFGGYATLPVGLAADALHIPLLVHEQNSYIGITNKLLSRRAQAVALGFVEAQPALDFRKDAVIRVTGNPVRSEFMASGIPVSDVHCHPARKKPVLHVVAGQDPVQAGTNLGKSSGTNLFVFGGSQGANSINEAVFGAALPILREFSQLSITHITGKSSFAEWSAKYSETLDTIKSEADKKLYQNQYNLLPYSEQMPQLLHSASLALCRSGASTLAELAATGTPAILVPLPRATADHQNLNAQALVAAGAAVKVDDGDLSANALLRVLHQVLDDKTVLFDMAQQMNSQFRQRGLSATADIAALLYDII